MDALMGKINEVYDELKKNVEVEKSKIVKLNELIEKNSKAIDDIKRRELEVTIKEKKYADYGSIEVAKKKNTDDKIALVSEKRELEEAKVALAAKSETIAKEKKELDNLIALYKKKSASVDELKAQLTEDRKNLEAKIIASFTKSLTNKV